MTAEAEQLYDLFRLVHPDEEVVVFDVAFHAAGIIPGEHVGFILHWYHTGITQQF